MKYCVLTLGCKVNQCETQGIEGLLARRGHLPAEDGLADVVIINTCAVTAESGRKSRQAIRRKKEQNPGAIVAVLGCFSQISPDEVKSLGADIIFGSGDRVKLVSAIEEFFDERRNRRETVQNIKKPEKHMEFEMLPVGSGEGRTRAGLKIQDGCNNFCSYCIIPHARGPSRSLSVSGAAQQAAELYSSGYRELVLTGIEIASYGRDLEGNPALCDVVEAVCAAAPGARIRLGSLEPGVITEEFCRRLAATGSVCRHFHLSLQSGCNETLRRMRRRYSSADFLSGVQLLRNFFPGCSAAADLIVGFPGESTGNHRESMEFIEKCGLSFLHIFPYSRRPGTPAADMPGQLSNDEKAKRAKEAKLLATGLKQAFLKSCVGRTLPVLFERCGEDFSEGHADNYCDVRVRGLHERGIVKNVQTTGILGEMLVGEVI